MGRFTFDRFMIIVAISVGVAALVSANGAKTDVVAVRDALPPKEDPAAREAKMRDYEKQAAAWHARDEADRKATRDAVAQFEERLAKLETRAVTTSGISVSAANAMEKAFDKAVDAADVAALEEKILSGDATPDEQARFWELLRENPKILADLMKQWEKAVADNPRDIDARMKLSRAYIEKLLTVPDGPEKGAWSMKAMDQYKKILEIDPNHWSARFRLAFNYSQWPDFLNKRPDAIREFETLKKIQEGQTPNPEHAQTYFQLRQLYLKDGRADDAKAVLEEGLRRFPDDEELKKARDGAK